MWLKSREGSIPPKLAAPKAAGIVSWPKVHIIYFVLAAIDVAAIIASLAVGHRLITTFEKGIDRNLVFDRQISSLQTLSDATSDAYSLVVEGFLHHEVDVARSTFTNYTSNFQVEFARIGKQVDGATDGPAKKRLNTLLKKLNTVFSSVEERATSAFDLIDAGDVSGAREAVSQMQSRYLTLRFVIRDINQYVGLLRRSGTERDFKTVASVRQYEYLLAGVLAFIICCVIAYGHFIGSLMKRKYTQIADINEKLEISAAESRKHNAEMNLVNEDIINLNRELQENLTKLREAQDESLRKGKMAQLGQLTATVAHELRNPLGAVRTSSFLMERKLKGKGLGVEAQLNRINSGVTRCDTIISQLLDFSRTRALQCELHPLDEWLTKFLEEEVQALPEAVSVECHLGTGGELIAFDPSRMGRVLINLISNAAEAMVGKGDDPSKFTTSDPRIEITSKIGDRGAEISVADNGPGISDADQQKIFEPLFTTKNFGTGLGLPAVQKILEQHGGGLEFNTALGKGTKFTAWWPHATSQEEAA